MRIAMGLAGLVLAVAVDRAALAGPSEPARVLVVADDPDHPIHRQLRAELRLLGLDVVHEANPGGPAIALDLAHATATVRVPALDGSVVERTLTIAEVEGWPEARVEALRVTEVLRAAIRDAESRMPPPPVRAEPEPATRDEPRPSHRLAIAIAPAIGWSPGGVSPSFDALLGMSWLPHPRAGLELEATVPAVAGRVEGPEGVAAVWPFVVGLGPRVVVTPVPRRAWLELGAIVGPAFVVMRGRANAAYRGRQDLVTTAAVRGRIGLGVAVHPLVRLRLDARVGALLPAVAVRLGGREAARWGQPSVGGSLGVEIVWPAREVSRARPGR